MQKNNKMKHRKDKEIAKKIIDECNLFYCCFYPTKIILYHNVKVRDGTILPLTVFQGGERALWA